MTPRFEKRLHPALREWFHAQFEDYSPIQRQALPLTTAGKNTLILAPTGTGKTLAGFLSVLSELGHRSESGALHNAVGAVYVSPLKALDRDIHRKLEPPLAALNAALPPGGRIRMDVRTGDTEMPLRARQQRHRPHLLLTTPESLASLISQVGWKEGLRPFVVLVDEIHAFAENKRGSLLTLVLERLEERAGVPMQRLGLSATAWPHDAVRKLLCGTRPCEIASVNVARAHRLEIAVPPPDLKLPAGGYSPFRTAPLTSELVKRARCSLVFTSTRSAAEMLGLALKVLLPEEEERIAVHHGSIGREERHTVEEALADGLLRAVMCSTSLELGVDFQAVDQVLLIGCPRGVSRALQRLGRSGRRLDGVARGLLVPLTLPDLLECIAIREAARNGRLDPLRVPRAPLDVLAQSLLGMAVERQWKLDEAYALVRRAGPYANLSRDDFDAVVNYLSGGGRVLGAYGKIVVDDGMMRVASRKAAREYYTNIGAISDDFQVKIMLRGRSNLGSVEEGFLATLQPGEAFIIGGRSVKLKMLHQTTAIVEAATGERVKTPRWMGGKMSLTAQLSAEERRLRQLLREAWAEGGREACRRALVRECAIPEELAQIAADYVARQVRAAPVPVESPVQVEIIEQKRAVLLLFHVVAGRAINRALAWAAGQRYARWRGLSASVVANFDDHAFLISVDRRKEASVDIMREWFNPNGWREDLAAALAATETLGRKFRNVAEIGQLLPKRTLHGNVNPRSASWTGSLLYSTLLKHEPDHPLLREAQREVLEDQLDATNAERESARIYEAPWEVIRLPRPSPFALPLFSSFHAEVLMTQNPDAALDEIVNRLYDEWAETESN